MSNICFLRKKINLLVLKNTCPTYPIGFIHSTNISENWVLCDTMLIKSKQILALLKLTLTGRETVNQIIKIMNQKYEML